MGRKECPRCHRMVDKCTRWYSISNHLVWPLELTSEHPDTSILITICSRCHTQVRHGSQSILRNKLPTIQGAPSPPRQRVTRSVRRHDPDIEEQTEQSEDREVALEDQPDSMVESASGYSNEHAVITEESEVQYRLNAHSSSSMPDTRDSDDYVQVIDPSSDAGFALSQNPTTLGTEQEMDELSELGFDVPNCEFIPNLGFVENLSADSMENYSLAFEESQGSINFGQSNSTANIVTDVEIMLDVSGDYNLLNSEEEQQKVSQLQLELNELSQLSSEVQNCQFIPNLGFVEQNSTADSSDYGDYNLLNSVEEQQKLSQLQLELDELSQLSSEVQNCQFIPNLGFVELNSTADSSDNYAPVSQRSILVSNFDFIEGSEAATASSSQVHSISTGSGLSVTQRIKLGGIKTSLATQKRCFLCGNKDGRMCVPDPARMQAWLVKRIRIPKGNRCCKHHINCGRFTNDALDQLKEKSEVCFMNVTEISEMILSLTKEINKKTARIDFDDVQMTDQDYETLTGWNKLVFDDLLLHCTGMRNSVCRSKRNALGMFLTQLRLNLSQRVLGHLFGIKNQPTVSDTLETVLIKLEQSFVPENLGYRHKSRSDLIINHTIPSFDNLLMSRVEDEEGAPLEDHRLQLIFDATYLYIQKPSMFEMQRRTFSQQKARNLLKPMMTVTSTGYIVDASDVYFADYKNNDAAILLDIFKSTDLLNLLEIGDHVIVDRGFRDAVDAVEDHALYTHMPELLPRTRKQFSTLEGNRSRKVTMIRFVVEAVNGRVKKKFKFFDSVIHNSYIPKLGRLFRVACAVINKHSPPIMKATQAHTELVELALSVDDADNKLQTMLEAENLLTTRANWVEASHFEMPEFPKITKEDLRRITLGVYQVRMARHYAEEHRMEHSDFKIFLHKQKDNLLKAKLQSRFRRAHKHLVFIQFVPNGKGAAAITGRVCTCKTGNRTIGTCSHVTTVIQYLGYSRHNSEDLPRSKRRNWMTNVLDAASGLAEETSESEGEDEPVESN